MMEATIKASGTILYSFDIVVKIVNKQYLEGIYKYIMTRLGEYQKKISFV